MTIGKEPTGGRFRWRQIFPCQPVARFFSFHRVNTSGGVSVLKMSIMLGAVLSHWLIFLLPVTINGNEINESMMAGITSPQSIPLIWCCIIDFALTGNVYKTTNAKNQNLCHDACKAHPECMSSNYGSLIGLCELSSVTHYNYSGDLNERHGWIYTYTQLQVGPYFVISSF